MSLSNPAFDEIKSQCPQCGKLYGYEPDESYICEVGKSAIPPHGRTVHVGPVGCWSPPFARQVTLISFSFKYERPAGTWMLDVRRTVRNPWREPELRKLSGLDTRVQQFVGRCRGAQRVLATVRAKCQMGAGPLTLSIGCMGGRHRSVALVELVAAGLKHDYPAWTVIVHHRDMNKRGKNADD